MHQRQVSGLQDQDEDDQLLKPHIKQRGIPQVSWIILIYYSYIMDNLLRVAKRTLLEPSLHSLIAQFSACSQTLAKKHLV